MNEVFLIGEIVSNINFDFMINSKHKSISRFKIKTLDNQILDIKAYDNQADFVYRKSKQGDSFFIYGRLEEVCILIKDIIII